MLGKMSTFALIYFSLLKKYLFDYISNKTDNLSFGFISLEVREIFSMIFVIFFKSMFEMHIDEKKRTKSARKAPEFQDDKLKTQVDKVWQWKKQKKPLAKI